MDLREKRPALWLGAVTALVSVWLVAPVLIIIPLSFTGTRSFQFPPQGWSFQWYQSFFSDPEWYESLFFSLRVAVIVMVAATVLGTSAAFALARGTGAFRNAFQGLIMLPMIVPIIVSAVATMMVFLQWNLNGNILGFVAAHTALALPFVVIAVGASLSGFDRKLETAAASLGATPWSTFRRVTLPSILPGVLSGAVFAFVTSLDEAVVSLFLATPGTRTLPVQMFSSVTVQIDPTIAAASSVVVVVTTALVLGPQIILSKRKAL